MGLAKELKERAAEALKKKEDEKWKPYKKEIDELFQKILGLCEKVADEGKEDLMINSETYPELWAEIYIFDPNTGEYGIPNYIVKVIGKLDDEGFCNTFYSPTSQKENNYLHLFWDHSPS